MPLLVLLFLVLPIAEIYVIIQVGQAIGILPTLALLFLDGFVGAALARSQGRAVWRRFNEAMAAGRVPGKEVFDGAAVILGGALLLSPGFITDVIGFTLLLPPGRALLRRLMFRGATEAVPGGPMFAFYQQRRGGRRPDVPGFGGPTPGSGPGPGIPPRPPAGRPYDVEGTAREVPDSTPELGRGDSDE